MTRFLDLMHSQGVVVLDGGLATELEARGEDLKDPLWSASLLIRKPDTIRQCHYDFYAAGADVCITATYQATIEGLMNRDLSRQEARDLFGKAVELAVTARDQFWSEDGNRKGRRYPLVAASLGCYGAHLNDGSEYRGRYGLTIEGLMDFHRPHMLLLAESGGDVIACETVPCMDEAIALARLAKEGCSNGKPVWISFACSGPSTLNSGEAVSEAVSEVLKHSKESPLMALGVNCTAPSHVTDLLEAMSAEIQRHQCTSDVILLTYPNSGETYEADKMTWQENSRDVSLASSAGAWLKAGATVIGGCCRTGVADIAELRATIEQSPLYRAPSRL